MRRSLVDARAQGRAVGGVDGASAHIVAAILQPGHRGFEPRRVAVEQGHERAVIGHRFGVHVVFANVGIDSPPGFQSINGERNPDGAFENVSDERWDLVMETNLTSIFTTIKASVPHMEKNAEGGRIIVTTSTAGTRAEAVVGMPYMPAKAGAAHLVRQAALELARYNILVNAIAPGFFFVTNIGGGHMHDPEVVKVVKRFNPMHRVASTDEIQGLALFLASLKTSPAPRC